MKRGGIRKNNRGDSLILVIGCIALLSVLGIVILAKSVDNQTMKMAEKSAQESFFKADNASAELAAVLEAVSLEAIEDAFSDMLIEYSYSATDDARKQRYKEFFEARLSQKLTSVSGSELYNLLNAALPGGLTDMTVSYDGITMETGEEGKTDIIKIKNVKLTYSASGSKTTVTTDITIQTQIPDITGGFRPTVNCSFSDFALISDGAITLDTHEDADVLGNIYTGGTLTSSGAGYAMSITDASKVLVKGDIRVDSGATINISNGGVAVSERPSVWADGIYIKGGGTQASSIITSNMNVYVSDDLTVEGENADITMSGGSAEYVGYSGKDGVSGLAEYKKSSAITINAAKKLTLDFSGMKQVLLTGMSYIHEDGWDITNSDGAGIMQGESIAYKDMQAMYLVPSDCMDSGHNPVMDGESESFDLSGTYMLGGTEITWSNYLDSAEPAVTRRLLLDGGSTIATYVYLNFKDEASAAKYIELYMASDKGNFIREQAKNLGNDTTIKLPGQVYTQGNALTYESSVTTMRPRVENAEISKLLTGKVTAKYRYNSLFSSLKENAGGAVPADYKMVANGITTLGSSENLGLVKTIVVPDPIVNTTEYTFYYYDGDLTISGSPYSDLNGILLVNGDVTVASGAAHMKGLILATGEVKITQNAKFEANPTAVTTLLTNSEVAAYFKGFGGGSSQSFLSSEAVDIKFDNWKRN